jgi:hypothetical protein
MLYDERQRWCVLLRGTVPNIAGNLSTQSCNPHRELFASIRSLENSSDGRRERPIWGLGLLMRPLSAAPSEPFVCVVYRYVAARTNSAPIIAVLWPGGIIETFVTERLQSKSWTPRRYCQARGNQTMVLHGGRVGTWPVLIGMAGTARVWKWE